jgi:muramoyltetrapeptide carboxypeptidase
MAIKPARLNYGDTVGVVAPASAPANPRNIGLALSVLEEMGFKAKPAKNLRKRWGFLAGSDQERAADIMQMFGDPEVRAIICMRGGYGAARLLSLLDYDLVRADPKIFIGYSDITSLHCALLTKSNLVSFHGPMLNSDFLKPQVPEFTRRSFLRTLMQPSAPGSLCHNYRLKTVQIISRGIASGPLVGGNISILCASLATPYQPRFKGAILFFEDLDEEPYRYDRMLTQLLNAGLLQQVAGIAIGINRNCKDPKAKRSTEYRQTLEQVFRDRLLPLNVPIVVGLPFGHTRHNATLPVGARATLDAEKGDLLLTEAAVV